MFNIHISPLPHPHKYFWQFNEPYYLHHRKNWYILHCNFRLVSTIFDENLHSPYPPTSQFLDSWKNKHGLFSIQRNPLDSPIASFPSLNKLSTLCSSLRELNFFLNQQISPIQCYYWTNILFFAMYYHKIPKHPFTRYKKLQDKTMRIINFKPATCSSWVLRGGGAIAPSPHLCTLFMV